MDLFVNKMLFILMYNNFRFTQYSYRRNVSGMKDFWD